MKRAPQSRVLIALSLVIVVNQAVAVLCQFIQHTDRVFPLLYFTVDSAILAAAVSLLGLLSPRRAHLVSLRLGSSVAVMLSALIFAGVIAPASESGTWFQPYDDYWVRTATVLFHLVAPLLVTADFLLRDVGEKRTPILAAQAFIWPLGYLVALYGLSVICGFRLPYPFLDPHQLGWLTVCGSIAALGFFVGALAALLLSANRWLHGIRK